MAFFFFSFFFLLFSFWPVPISTVNTYDIICIKEKKMNYFSFFNRGWVCTHLYVALWETERPRAAHAELDRVSEPHGPGTWRLNNIISFKSHLPLAANRICALSTANYSVLLTVIKPKLVLTIALQCNHYYRKCVTSQN